jgi:PAS domain S-box-containing protein
MLAIVAISLAGNLGAAIVTALAATLSLDYFFTPPLFAIAIGQAIDIVALVAFGTTAVVVTRLIDKLRHSERRWRDVFENNPTMYFIVDAAGIVLSVNTFGAEQLGYTVDELTGQSVLRVFYESDRETVKGHVSRCLQHVGQSMSWELRKVRKDGSMLWVRETARAVLRSPTQPIVLVACEDITDRKAAEEELRRSRAALENARAELARIGRLTTMGELAASVAHEIRQPLAAIVLNGATTLRWLNREDPDLDEARRALSRIVHDAERVEEVMRGLRRLTQKSGPHLAPIDLPETIEEVLTLTNGDLHRQGVSVHTELDRSNGPVLGDRLQLQHVLLNLIANSVEAMTASADGPRVLTLRSEVAGPGEVVVSVEDTGPGLDPAILERVFDSFYTTKPGGLGLGLAICRSIVDAHGGNLWAEARSPRGAAFRFTLPRATE